MCAMADLLRSYSQYGAELLLAIEAVEGFTDHTALALLLYGQLLHHQCNEVVRQPTKGVHSRQQAISQGNMFRAASGTLPAAARVLRAVYNA